MELLRTLGIDWSHLLWSVINFLIVLFVLKRFAFGPIVDALAKRTAKIEEGLKNAQAAQDALASSKKERAAAVRAGEVEAHALLVEAKNSAEVIRTDMLEKAKAEVDEIVKQGKRRMIAEKETMVIAAKNEVATLLVDALEKVLPRNLGAKDHDALVSEAAAAFQGKGKGV